jgi:hypothetical protein
MSKNEQYLVTGTGLTVLPLLLAKKSCILLSSRSTPAPGTITLTPGPGKIEVKSSNLDALERDLEVLDESNASAQGHFPDWQVNLTRTSAQGD